MITLTVMFGSSVSVLLSNNFGSFFNLSIDGYLLVVVICDFAVVIFVFTVVICDFAVNL
jgi:hypothetical protein